MDIYNYTDFPALSFRQIQAGTGRVMACLTVKATCDLVPDAPLILAETQEPILFEDIYLGDPHETSLVGLADLIPFKPAADVTVLASCWPAAAAPGGVRAVSVSVGDVAHAMTILTGRRRVREGDAWRVEQFAAADPLALSWRNTYGGVLSYEGEPPHDVVRENPLGCGAVDLASVSGADMLPLPSVVPYGGGAESKEPCGMAPVPPWWKGRQQHAGTYDEDWLNEVHPRLPDDFDYRFYQVAPPPLIGKGYLAGGQAITLIGLLPGQAELRASLPLWAPRVSVALRTNETFAFPLNLDGCHFKLTGPACRVVLTWRAWIADADLVRAFKIETENLDGLISERNKAQKVPRPVPWPEWEESPPGA